MKTREAVFSIPDFASFFTNFVLPPMRAEELQEAIGFEARKHIPLPLSEVSFDWQIVAGKVGRQEPLEVLLVAVPNEVLYQYREIASMARVQLKVLEAEVFGLIRSGLGGELAPVLLMDIGAQTTTLSLVLKGVLHTSHSVDTAGSAFTARIAQALLLERDQAEKEKVTKGFQSQDLFPVLSPLADLIILEAKKMIDTLHQLEGKEVARVFLGGGSARLQGLREYMEKEIGKPTVIIDPFRSIFYPPILEKSIQEDGPAFAVAVGMALRGLQ